MTLSLRSSVVLRINLRMKVARNNGGTSELFKITSYNLDRAGLSGRAV